MSLLVLSSMPPEAPLYSNQKPYKSLISLELNFPRNNPTSFPNKTLISQQRHIIDTLYKTFAFPAKGFSFFRDP